ncbi:peptidase S8/S53 domain-containing protein [Mycena capillaripes]|nr:peptidase S8/S53 domain-containing protein [Mycena capillaripes]
MTTTKFPIPVSSRVWTHGAAGAPRVPPAGFTSQSPAPGSEIITIRVGLTSNNIAGLQDKLLSVSTPGEVKSYVQPSPATVAAFTSFELAHGLHSTVISPHGEWVSIALSVAQANALFGAHFEKFNNPEMSTPFTRTLSVSLPEELVGHVQVLHPKTAFDRPSMRASWRFTATERRARRRRRAVPPDSFKTADDSRMPVCLQALYGIPTTAATQTSSTLLVTGYTEQWARRADLVKVLQDFHPDIPPYTTYALDTLDGGTGLATDVPVTFLSVGDGETEEAFFTQLLDTTTYLAGVTNPPNTMTTSYGANEVDFGSSLATSATGIWLSVARGISVLFASGDERAHSRLAGGVRGGHDDETQCTNNTFIPVFPPSCPYVTSVGATVNFDPEIADPSPAAYSAVATYLETLPSDFSGIFNSSGRGFPDVAFQGDAFVIVFNNKTDGFGGTSCSSPGFASVIALINDRLIAPDRPALGFLNPWLYKDTEALTDVSIGHNAGDACENTPFSGFDASVGWDPLTGLGTPIFDKLLAAALA